MVVESQTNAVPESQKGHSLKPKSGGYWLAVGTLTMLASLWARADDDVLFELHSWAETQGDSFQVTLRPNGVLTALHQSRSTDVPGDEEQKSLVIDGEEAKALYELAVAAVGENSLTSGCKAPDADRSASLRVRVAGKDVRSDCANAAGWPSPKTKAARLVEQVNALLPPSMQFH